MGYEEEPRGRWVVAGIFFALVGWLPFGAGSALAIVFGRRALRRRHRTEEEVLAVGTRVGAWLAIGGGFLGAVVLPLSLIAYAGVCSQGQPGGVFGGSRMSQIVLAGLTFAAPPVLMGAIAWVGGRRSLSMWVRFPAVVILSAAELLALWWAFLAFYSAGDGGC